MINIIHAEVYKLRKSTAVKISVLLSAVCAAALTVISHYFVSGDVSQSAVSSASGLSEVMIMSLFGSLMAGIIVCTDFETKVIHDEIANCKSRSVAVFSKVIVFVIMIAVLMLPYIAASLIAVASGMEFAKPFIASVFINIISENADTAMSLSAAGSIIAVYLAEIMVYAARVSICIPIAFKVKKPMAVMGIGFVGLGLLDFVLGLVLDIDRAKDILEFTPFCRDYMLISVNEGAGSLIKISIICLVFIIIMTSVSAKMFKKAEIK